MMISKNLEETQEIAKKIAQNIVPPCIIALYGEMGAGKTAFAQGFAQGLGIKEAITSPTFAIMNVYNVNGINFNHLDLYRIENEEELEYIGIYDEILKKNSISLIEWPTNAPSMDKYFNKKFYIKKIDENTREIEEK